MNVIDKIEREQMKSDVPDFRPGDTVNVHSRVVEGGKERIQIYKGIVISRHGSRLNEAFTVRKISNGTGVERSFQIHSAKTAKIEVLKLGKVRKRVKDHYRAEFSYSPELVDVIAERCTEVDTGARNIDYILTKTLLPEMSAEFLARMAEGRSIEAVKVTLGDDGAFRYEISENSTKQ